MKTPPLLLLAAFAFWGWQSEQWLVGLGVGLLLECVRFIPLRWELVEEDFRRIWSFCILLMLAQVVLVFTLDNEGASNAYRTISAGAHSATTFLRWIPIMLAPLLAAQYLSQAGKIPLAAILIRAVAAERETGVMR